MSAQVVLPAKLPQPRVGNPTNSKSQASVVIASSSASSVSNRTSATSATNRFNRFRAPRKPEIQIDKNELRQKLTPLQYKVTQEKFTERPFSGEYVRLNDKGIYCCVVCGEELFSSETKYDSGCGWPAFFNSIDNEKLILQTDLTHVGGNLLLLALNQDLARTEVTCAKCGSHLGHVFDDGPKPTGKRYCVNSASLKFKKANGEEVICDIPSNGSCCFRSPTKTLTSKDVEKNSKNQKLTDEQELRPIDNKPSLGIRSSLIPKPRLEIQINEAKQTKAKSLSPKSKPESQTTTNVPIYSSSHARRVQMNKEDFFKSINTKPVLNRIKKIPVQTLDEESIPSFKNDVNNNKTTQNKYSDVKSRYLDHLDSLGKKSVIKHTFGTKKLSNIGMHTANTVLESDL